METEVQSLEMFLMFSRFIVFSCKLLKTTILAPKYDILSFFEALFLVFSLAFGSNLFYSYFGSAYSYKKKRVTLYYMMRVERNSYVGECSLYLIVSEEGEQKI